MGTAVKASGTKFNLYFTVRTKNNVLILMEINVDKENWFIYVNYRSESLMREPELEEFLGLLLTKDFGAQNYVFCGRWSKILIII